MGLPFTRNINCFSGKDADMTTGTAATVANTAAKVIDLSNRQLKSIQFSCSGHTSGNGAFGVEVSNDGTNWVVYNRLVSNTTVADGHNPALVAAPTLSTNTSAIYFFPTGDIFQYIRVFVTVTTDGTYYAQLQAGG